MSRTISVTGKGSISVKPDMIRLCFNMSGVRPEYNEALRLSSDESGALKKCLQKLGFKDDALKTTSFSIDSKYENYRDEKNEYVREFVGYEYRHSAYIAFEADNVLLGKILSAIAAIEIAPEFHIEYTVRDLESARKKLLEAAVKDARAKAECITTAANVALDVIEAIDYAFEDEPIVSRPLSRAMMCAKANDEASFDIEPDDIKLTDSVRIVWSIRAL